MFLRFRANIGGFNQPMQMHRPVFDTGITYLKHEVRGLVRVHKKQKVTHGGIAVCNLPVHRLVISKCLAVFRHHGRIKQRYACDIKGER